MSFVKGIREFGLEYALKFASWTIPFGLFRYEHTLILAARNPIYEVEDAEQVETRLLTINDVALLERLRVPPEVAIRRLELGDFCAAAFQDGKIAAMCWSASGSIFMKQGGSSLDMGNEEFYIYNSFTHESARGKGLYRHCARLLCQSNLRAGRTVVLGAISRFNPRPLEINKRQGLREVGDVILFRLFGLSFLWYRKWPYRISRFRFYLGSVIPGSRVM